MVTLIWKSHTTLYCCSYALNFSVLDRTSYWCPHSMLSHWVLSSKRLRSFSPVWALQESLGHRNWSHVNITNQCQRNHSNLLDCLDITCHQGCSISYSLQIFAFLIACLWCLSILIRSKAFPGHTAGKQFISTQFIYPGSESSLCKVSEALPISPHPQFYPFALCIWSFIDGHSKVNSD